jgi:hypothetical protein
MRRTLIAGLVLAVLGNGGCALLGGNLPPGNRGGHFADKPKGLPRMSGTMRARADALDSSERKRVDGRFELLKDLIQSSAALREQVARSQARLAKSFEEDRQVDAADKELLLEGAHWFIELDLLLYSLWTDYRAYLPYGSEPDPYAPSRAASLLDDATRVKGGLVALAAEVVRMDNAAVVLGMLEGQWALTQFLNQGDDERGILPESFDRMVGAFWDPDRRSLLQHQLRAVQEQRKRLDSFARADGEVAFLLALLEESEVAQKLSTETSVGRQARYTWAIAARSGVALLTPFLNLYIAAVLREEAFDPSQLRRLAATPGLYDTLLDSLEPLDVLVLRDVTRSRTGRGYTHAVVYLGD